VPSNVKGPEFVQYFGPVLKALKELGGIGSAADVVETVARIKNVSEAEQDKKNKGGALRFYNQVAWARQYLMWGGYLDGSKRGVWRLTEKGIAATAMSHGEALALFKQQHALHLSAGKADETEGEEGEGEDESQKAPEGYKEKLLSILRSLAPAAFERLCKRLLGEYGLEKVEVTGGKGDEGIDGSGILKVNKFVTFKVMFQCKRYSGAVGPDKVREFRGAMHSATDKGIMLTTGTFTKSAQAEALSKIPQIELVDGDQLVLLFEERKLGLVPTYDVDLNFFEQFKADG
jgi:restriction system protein